MSQHIGDLETPEAADAFKGVCADLQRLYAPAVRLVCDRHPDYLSTTYARSRNLPVRAVQHHHAHLASCMAENELEGEVLGVIWDGTGYGPDGTVWGGEFLRSTPGRRGDADSDAQAIPASGWRSGCEGAAARCARSAL